MELRLWMLSVFFLGMFHIGDAASNICACSKRTVESSGEYVICHMRHVYLLTLKMFVFEHNICEKIISFFGIAIYSLSGSVADWCFEVPWFCCCVRSRSCSVCVCSLRCSTTQNRYTEELSEDGSDRKTKGEESALHKTWSVGTDQVWEHTVFMCKMMSMILKPQNTIPGLLFETTTLK